MASDLEKLVVQLSADIKGYEREMKKAMGVTNRQARAIENRFRLMNRNLDGIGKRAARSIIAPLAGVGAALGVRELMRMADAWSEMQARVTNATGSLEAGTQTMGRLTEMARRTYSGLEATAESYLRNSTALTELGYSTEQQLDLTETLNNAMVISATRGQRAESVMNAWGKAMALGELSGENLNSVIQGSDRLTKALADSMGVSTTELRKLGAEGKITTRVMYGVTSQLGKLRDETDAMPATLADAFQILRDALLQYVGVGDQAMQISRRVAEAVILVADNFNVVADAAVQLGFVITSALIGRALGGMLMVIPNAVAAMGALTLALRAGALTAVGFSAALGPIGLAAGAAAAALYLLMDSQTDAEKAADTHEAALRVLESEILSVDLANGQAVASTRAKIAADIDATRVALSRARAERALQAAVVSQALNPTMQGLGYAAPPPNPLELQAVVDRQRDVVKAQELIDQIEANLSDLEDAQSRFEGYVSDPSSRPTVRDRASASSSGDGAGGGRRGRSSARDDALTKEIDQVVERTKALQAEMAVQAGLNPLIQDYGFAVEKARAERELLLAAEKAGVEVTPQLREKIEGLAEAYATASAASEKLKESQQEIVQAAQDMEALRRDAMGGFIKDLIQGKSAADAFASALGKIGDKLIDIALNSMFSGGGGGGGIFGAIGAALFGGFRAGGGPVSAGRAYVVGEKRPEVFVPNRSGMIIPSVAQASRGGSASGPVQIVVDVRGATGNQEVQSMVAAGVLQGMAQVRKEVPGIVANAQVRMG